MRLTLARRTSVLIAGAALPLVVTLGGVPADAASAPGWTINTVFAGPDHPYFPGIAVSGPSNAWLAGSDDLGNLATEQWTGSQWQTVRPPAALTNVPAGDEVTVDALGTSAPGNTWVIADLDKSNGKPTTYAARWNGTAWTVFSGPDVTSALATAVFSATDAWDFGAKGSVPSGGFGAPVVDHWNGTSWRPVSVPVGTPVEVDPVAANDIWALGPSAATVSDPVQTFTAMHWNGVKWSALSLPKFPTVRKLYQWIPEGIQALGASDIWVQEVVSANRGTGEPGKPGVRLLHWNGKKWAIAARDKQGDWAPGLTADGHGGFWLTGAPSSGPGNGTITDYRDGKWSTQPAPTKPGDTTGVDDITAVPGTSSFWASGVLDPTGRGFQESDVLHYSP